MKQNYISYFAWALLVNASAITCMHQKDVTLPASYLQVLEQSKKRAEEEHRKKEYFKPLAQLRTLINDFEELQNKDSTLHINTLQQQRFFTDAQTLLNQAKKNYGVEQ